MGISGICNQNSALPLKPTRGAEMLQSKSLELKLVKGGSVTGKQ